MNTVGAHEARTHLSQLLKRVADGEQITITRHGVPIAMLVPASGDSRRNLSETIAAMREARKGRRLGGLSIRAMIDEGRL